MTLMVLLLAAAENILSEAVITVFRVRVQDKIKVFVDQIKFIFGLMDVVP
jgi:hypothetical protein